MTNTPLFVRITNVPTPVTANQLTVTPKTGGGLDFGGGTAISAGFPPFQGSPLPDSRALGTPVITTNGRRAISVEDLGWATNPRPSQLSGPTNTRISPYSTGNPFSPSGLTRRTPSSRAAVLGVGANAALDIAYEIAELDAQYEDLPCPEISDQDFYNELGTNYDDIVGQLQNATTLAQIRDISGSISRVSGTAALGLFVSSVAGLSAPVTAPAAAVTGTVSLVSGGVSALATLFSNQGRRNDRNLALLKARGSTARRLQLTGSAGCPLPTDRELLQRIFDCCFPEISFTARRSQQFRTLPEPGFVPVLICDVLVLSNQVITKGWIKTPNGLVELDVSGITRTGRIEYQEFSGSIRSYLLSQDGIDFNSDITLDLVLEAGGRLVYRDLTIPASGSGSDGITASLVIDETIEQDVNGEFYTQLTARIFAISNLPNTVITGVFLNWTGPFDFTFDTSLNPSNIFSESYIIDRLEVDLNFLVNFELFVEVDETVKVITTEYRLSQDSIAAVPDYWPTRPGAGRPCLVIQFAEFQTGGPLLPPDTVLQIPWYIGPPQPTTSPIGPYQKGSYRVDAVLSDNSRIRVHAVDEQEALRVISEALTVVDPTYLVDLKIRKSPDSLPQGRTGLFVPRLLKWFPTGQKDLLPAWIVRL